jgi:hypothetical protein
MGQPIVQLEIMGNNAPKLHRQPRFRSAASEMSTTRTRALLAGGVVAGPLFSLVGLIQSFTRPGFDIRRHALSVLETGDLGWIQMSSFVITGLLFVGGAAGMRRVMHGGRGGTWGPMLIGAFGVGMIGAGCFTADPAFGFPPGTPPEANTISWHGIVHLSVATLGFAALIAAGFVWTRRFASQRRWGWAAYSAITALIFFVSFAGLASGQLFLTPAFVVTALNAFVWVSVMAAMLLSGEPRTSA